MKVGLNRLRDLIEAPVWNIAQSFYDQYVEANVRFRQSSGFHMIIIRRQVAKCCDWCAKLAGVYPADQAPKDIYRRHDNCRCMVTTTTEKGGYKDAWSKKEYAKQRDARIDRQKAIAAEYEGRKARGLNTDSRKGFYDGLRRKEMVRRYKAGKRNPENRGTIAEKVLNGEYNLNYKSQKYEQHSKDHIKYKQATEGRGTLQSYLTISKEEAQDIIYKHAGTGTLIKRKTAREYIDLGKVIGYYHDINGVSHPTKRIMILYSKGGAHIVPVVDVH